MAGLHQVDTITNSAGTGGPAYPNGQAGVADNSVAASGIIGEIISNSASVGSITSQTSGGTNITSIVLTSGDWEVFGSFKHTRTGGADRSLVWTYSGLNTVSATLPTNGYNNTIFDNGSAPLTNDNTASPVPNQVFHVAAATTVTVYLVLQINFTTSTSSAEGAIHARRMR